MISWIQTHIFRHLRWLMAGLLVIIIISFILMSGPLIDSSDKSLPPNRLFGHDFNSPVEVELLRRRSLISNALEPSWQTLPNIMIERVTLLELANTGGIPSPNQSQLEGYLKSHPFFSINGQFNADSYRYFLDNIRSNLRLPTEEFTNVLAENHRIDQVVELLLGPGFGLPLEAQKELALGETSWSVDIIDLDDAALGLDELTVKDAELEDYFIQNKERYRIPEEVIFSLISFPLDNYLENLSIQEPSEAILRTYYRNNKAQFAPPALPETQVAQEANPDDTEASQEQEASETEPDTDPFITVKEAVYQAWMDEQKAEQARAAAQYAAADFAVELDTKEIKRNTPAFDETIANAGAVPISIDPLSQNTQAPASDLELLARSLDDSRYFSSEPITLEDGAAILILEGNKPSYLPDFTEAKEQAHEDLLEDKRRQAFYEAGKNMREDLVSALAKGQSFAEAAEARGLQFESIDNFSAQNPPEGNWRDVLIQPGSGSLAFIITPLIASLEQGQISDFADGRLIYIREKEATASEPDAASLSAALKRLNSTSREAAHWSLLNELVALEQIEQNH